MPTVLICSLVNTALISSPFISCSIICPLWSPAIFSCCHLVRVLLLHYLLCYLCELRLTKGRWHRVVLTAYEQYFSFSRSDGHEVTAITSFLFFVIITKCWSYVHPLVSLEITEGQTRKRKRIGQTETLIMDSYSESSNFFAAVWGHKFGEKIKTTDLHKRLSGTPKHLNRP